MNAEVVRRQHEGRCVHVEVEAESEAVFKIQKKRLVLKIELLIAASYIFLHGPAGDFFSVVFGLFTYIYIF